MSQNPEVLLESARELMAAGSSDSARASMQLLKASSDVAHAQLIAIFERAQRDLVKELVRLTNEQLVTYHIDAALSRVKVILDNLRLKSELPAEVMIHSSIILGRINSRRSQGKRDFLTAFDFIGQSDAKANRLIEQMLGHIDRAATCTEQSVRSQLQAACVKANMQSKDSQMMDITVSFPLIDNVSIVNVRMPLEKAKLPESTKKKLNNAPVETTKEMVAKAYESISRMRESYLIGRREADLVRQRTLASVAANEARGGGMVNAQAQLITTLMRDGLTAFVDRSGRRWTLGNYCEMAVRTTSRQSINHGELFDDPEHDLYIIVDRHSNCPICSRYEGRVYSRSGTNPNYPALSDAFTSIDKNAAPSLENTYLTIHPNCRHVIKPWNEITHTPQQIERMRNKSNPLTNPFDVDPRTKKQVEEYAQRERVMAEEAASVRMYRKMLQFIPAKILGSWIDFHQHYVKKDAWYEKQKSLYESKSKELTNNA